MRLELIDLIGQNQTIEGLSIETLYGKMTGIVFKVDERVYAIHTTKDGYYLHTLPCDTTFQYAILPNLCNATYSNEIGKGETIRYSDVDTGNLVLSITVVKVDGEYMLEVDNRTVSCTKPETYDVGKEHSEHESSMPHKTLGEILRETCQHYDLDDLTKPMTEKVKDRSKEVKKIRQQVLEKAIQMVCGDREEDYGSPEQSLTLIGKFWEDYVQAACVDENGKVHISGVDASVMMVLFKAARVALGRAKDDSFVDMCGYAANAAEIQKMTEKEKQPDEAE